MNRDPSPLNLSDETLLHVSLEQIIPNPKQPRKHFSQKTLLELTQTIRTQGILQPLVVRKHQNLTNCYELVAGERRWRALKQLDVNEVPVVLREVGDDEMLEVSLLENIQRENLTIIEEAQAYHDLLKIHDYTQEELAQRIGKDRSTITNLMRLLKLPSALKNDLETGRITSSHARSILALPSEDFQLEMRQRLLRHSWSVRDTERQVRLKLNSLSAGLEKQGNKKAISGGPVTKGSVADHDAQLQNLEEKLQSRLQTRVRIKYHKGKGHIQIDYFSLEEFDRVFDLLVSF